MKDFIKVMRALSEPNRVRIIKILQQRPLCVCNLQLVLGIAQPTVSNHLKVLEEAGLVTHRKKGLWVRYSLADGSRSAYAASLLGQLRHWLQDSPEVAQASQALSRVRDIEGADVEAPSGDSL